MSHGTLYWRFSRDFMGSCRPFWIISPDSENLFNTFDGHKEDLSNFSYEMCWWPSAPSVAWESASSAWSKFGFCIVWGLKDSKRYMEPEILLLDLITIVIFQLLRCSPVHDALYTYISRYCVQLYMSFVGIPSITLIKHISHFQMHLC